MGQIESKFSPEVTKKWRDKAMNLWAAAAYKPEYKYITEILQAEFGDQLTYCMVKMYLWKQKKKIDAANEQVKVYPVHKPPFVTAQQVEEILYEGLDKPTKPAKRVAIQNQEPNVIETKWDGTEVIKFGLISDTHMGSKYSQLTYLHEFYDICAKEGIKDVYHAGDITEGLRMRIGHEYELYAVSADDMRDDVVKNYPKRDGITTHFITGNHDASIYKHVGYDIGQAIANLRPDMKYLGRDIAKVNLTSNCTLELCHPWDGSAYSLSYKPQKRVEAMESDSKPNILAIGNYHKAEYFFYRNVHVFQTGCFQGQTPFMRGKNLSAQLGGWIVTIRVNKDGTIQGIGPELIPFYKSIMDDWKSFKSKDYV